MVIRRDKLGNSHVLISSTIPAFAWTVSRSPQNSKVYRYLNLDPPVLFGKSEGMRHRRRRRSICEDNIKMDLSDVDWVGLDWIHLFPDRTKLHVLVNMVTNF
jgi:hypothetical protein